MVFFWKLTEYKQELLFDAIERLERPHFLVETKDGIAVVRCKSREDIKNGRV